MKCTRCRKDIKKRYKNTGLCTKCGKMAEGTKRDWGKYRIVEKGRKTCPICKGKLYP